jgi:CheY-like chemotaxis protein
VDDEASLRRTMSLGLSQLGYDTEPCENGVNALKKLESYVKNKINLDAVVVDIKLPDIDGIKLVKIIKFKYPGIPIVLITGYADRYNLEEIRNLKVGAFMEKPFSADDLSQQVAQILATHSNETLQEESREGMSQSAYILVKISNEADFFEIYRRLYYLEGVLYCDATKGNYDIFLLLQADSMEKCREICDTQVKTIKGVASADFMEVGRPILDDSINSLLNAAEDAFSEGSNMIGRARDMSNRVCSYVLMEVEREKLDQVYPTLKLYDNVIFCDYTRGTFNLVLFVTGHHFHEIDNFIQQKVINLDGVLKVKEYPIVNLFEM